MLSIRPEEPGDINALDRIHRAAFGREHEGDLVRQLRESGLLIISLVATVSEHPIGHIAFSPLTPAIDGVSAAPLGLGPVGVDPEHERRGIASRLVQAGLEEAARLSTPYVAVLGDPAFYGRFGFQAAAELGLEDPFDAGDAFRVLALECGQLPPAGSHIRYPDAFSGL
ncbi:GNAT family N-acetyltransferase [Natronospira bacteriovora]|uniref:N-acetyltransferase n=1 Tax=Natronospira bacteriovora TaxID=3069753 RepID=A0ABU0W8A3_9GAMM|nr:N-acetyltransferase [Natronospira sp. AB-CW4]MDQ2070269.1 N-acetyltransferase [Natronospira sp. AB-CW4]